MIVNWHFQTLKTTQTSSGFRVTPASRHNTKRDCVSESTTVPGFGLGELVHPLCSGLSQVGTPQSRQHTKVQAELDQTFTQDDQKQQSQTGRLEPGRNTNSVPRADSEWSPETSWVLYWERSEDLGGLRRPERCDHLAGATVRVVHRSRTKLMVCWAWFKLSSRRGTKGLSQNSRWSDGEKLDLRPETRGFRTSGKEYLLD